MKAIILVAGYATRMYPLTLNTPKALLPLGGQPVIDYIVAQINKLDEVDKIYVVSNHKFFTAFTDWSRRTESRQPIEVLDDGTASEENRRGAIGDIFFILAEKGIDDDILVIAGDNFFTFDLKRYHAFFKEKQADTVCAGYLNDREQLRAFAVAVLAGDGKVLSLVEKPKEPAANIAVYAAYFYRRETLPLFSKYLAEGNNKDAPGSFPQWLHKIKDVYAYVFTDGECYDIGTVDAYESVDAMLLNEIKQENV